MKKIFAAGVIMSILSVLLSLCARKVTGFAQAYSVTIYPVLKGIFARIFGIFPFSVSEVGLYLLLLLCIFSVVKWFKTPLYLLNGAFFTASLLFFLFTINCGINYYRNSFSYEAGFVIRTHSTDDIYALCDDLVNKVNENIPTEIIPISFRCREFLLFSEFFLSCGKWGKEGRKP